MQEQDRPDDGAMSAPLEIDAYDGDWIKRGRWNLSATNIDELMLWLMGENMTPDEFKQLEVYKAHVETMPWLRELGDDDQRVDER